MPTKLSTHVRWMIRRDMPEVLDIERECFGSRAWTEDDFIRALRQRNCIGMVAEQGDAVLGYMLYDLHKSRFAVINFAVSPYHWRAGVGSTMLNKLKGKLSFQRRRSIEFVVADFNTDAHLFLKASGFRCVRIHREYFECGTEGYEFRFDYEPADDELHERVAR